MKRWISFFFVALMLASPAAEASNNVPYKNQKAGQFCKNLDIGKFVVTPSYGKLKCVKAQSAQRAKWIHA